MGFTFSNAIDLSGKPKAKLRKMITEFVVEAGVLQSHMNYDCAQNT